MAFPGSGILTGMVFAVVQTLFFSLFLKNNPAAEASFGTMFPETDPKAFILLTSPVIGGLYGMLIGGFSVAASRFHIPK